MPILNDQHAILQSIQVELREGIYLHRVRDRWTLGVDGRRINFCLPVGSAIDLFLSLQRGGCALSSLVGLPVEDAEKVTAWTELRKLWRQGWLVQRVSSGRASMAVLRNFGDTPFFPSPPVPSAALFLTEDALVRRTSEELAIESVMCGATVQCQDPRLFALPGLLLPSTNVEELSHALTLSADIVASVIAWLLALGAVSQSDASRPPLGWSFSDRLMHARSRRGRHIGGYGGSFPLRGKIPDPPAIRPPSSNTSIPLARPDLADIATREGSLTSVLERRHSIREHSECALRLNELSEFLYRVARVTTVIESGPYSIALRPYPSGGGLHELELYPLVNRCDGLAPALYRYNGATHALEHVSDPTPDTNQLLAEARVSCLIRGEPHVLLLIAARFVRVTWKYESIAYALTLKNVGVLYQTMYLVATAMGLAPCGLGGGNANGFSRATKLDYWEESLVGEFMLGRSSDVRAEPPGPHQEST